MDAERREAVSRPGVPPEAPCLGIVVPTLNEEKALPGLLEDLSRLDMAHRVLVVDGGSEDGTRGVAEAAGARWLTALRGRASQMNAGAAELDTPWLLFLHADVRMPEEARRALEEWLASFPPAPGSPQAAVFGFRLDARGAWWSVIEWGQWVRERLTGLAYGDQGLLVSRERFEAVGGFPELPVMEDVEMVRQLRKEGGVSRLPAPLVASARRYREEGPFRGWLRNAVLLGLYAMGVSPGRLARWYPPRNGSATRRLLLVFAKAPQPGRVKTRLAAALGDAEAAAIYRLLGRTVVEQVRRGPYRTVVCFDPPEAEAALRDWLGEEGIEFRPQAQGGLGERLTSAFEWARLEADSVCVIGTDAPGVDAARIEGAFGELEAPQGAELVVGPAHDGGYYLLALRSPPPPLLRTLFHDLPWSTDRVLELTLERARGAGLRLALLEPLADVDRPEDLSTELRAGR